MSFGINEILIKFFLWSRILIEFFLWGRILIEFFEKSYFPFCLKGFLFKFLKYALEFVVMLPKIKNSQKKT